MVQPSGMTRTQRRTKTAAAPYGLDRQGNARTVARGTGAKKIFGRFLDFAKWPLLIKQAHEKNVARKQAIANTAEAAARVQVPLHGSIGVD